MGGSRQNIQTPLSLFKYHTKIMGQMALKMSMKRLEILSKTYRPII